ncbi:hypothetical protein AX14_012424 [Amanita brunnescens Koide BX004]|nr:hypothetical protein AX14_012424 [Amanita brunnescens Koide BX004]
MSNTAAILPSLRDLARQAIEVELATIPAYLYAMYSIKLPVGDAYDSTQNATQKAYGARDKIRKIVLQEMLHLTLAGNLLTALGGTPKLYDPIVKFPPYPLPLFLPQFEQNPRLALGLEAACRQHLQTLQEAQADSERPDGRHGNADENIPIDIIFRDILFRAAVFLTTMFSGQRILAQHSKNIGSLYRGLGKRLFIHRNAVTFDHLDRQMGLKESRLSSQHSNSEALSGTTFPLNFVIDSVDKAKKIISFIADQGEGAPGGRARGPVPTGDSHYVALRDLVVSAPEYYHNHASDTRFAVHNVPKNPQTDSAAYRSDPYIHTLALASDAAYCYLLQTIERVWRTDPSPLRKLLVHNIERIMRYIMTPLAEILLEQILPGAKGNVAAPCFNYYRLQAGETLYTALENRVLEAEVLAIEKATAMTEARAAAEAMTVAEARAVVEARAVKEATAKVEARKMAKYRAAAKARAAEEAIEVAETRAMAELGAVKEARQVAEAREAAEDRAVREAREVKEAREAAEARAVKEVSEAAEARMVAEARAVREARQVKEARAAAEARAMAVDSEKFAAQKEELAVISKAIQKARPEAST